MATRKRALAWVLAFVFLAVNLLVAVPQTALAAAGLTFDPKISDFDGTEAEVKDKIYSYQPAELQVGDGFGINGTRGVYMKTNTETEHRIQGSDKFPVKQGKTYYMSVWAKTPTEDTGFALRAYFLGYHFDITVNGTSNQSKTSGIYQSPSAKAEVGKWQQYTMSFTVNKVYRQYKVDGTPYYVEIPVNADGTYPTGTASGTNATDGVFTPDGKGTVAFDAFLAIGCYNGSSWNNSKQKIPTEIYADGWYIIEEDSASSADYARAMVTNAAIENERGEAAAKTGTVLTAKADVGNANPKAENTLSYQWQISDNGTDYTDISGETNQTYTVKAADAEKFVRAQITVESTGAVSGKSSMSAVSNAIEIPDAITGAIEDVNVEAATTVLKVGESAELNAKAVDASGSPVAGAAVSYTSSDTDVAVIQDGKITAKREGTTTVTAQAGSYSKSYILIVYSNVIKEQKFESNAGLTTAAFADKTSIQEQNSGDVHSGEGSRTGTGNYYATNQASIVLTDTEVDGRTYNMGTSGKRFFITAMSGANTGSSTYGTLKERGIFQVWFYDDGENGSNSSNKGKQVSFEFMSYGGKGDYQDENGQLYPKFPNGTDNTGDTSGNGWTHAFRNYFRFDGADNQYNMSTDSTVFGTFTKAADAPRRSKGWHQLIIDYTKDNEYAFYVDGQLVYSRNTGDLPSNGGISFMRVDRHGISLDEDDASHYIRISDLAKYDVTITANYDISIDVGANGSVKVGDNTYAGGTKGTENVLWGQDLSMTITPDTDYLIDSVLVDGKATEVGADGVLTLSNIKNAASVKVTFKSVAAVNKYNFSVSASNNGSVTVNGTAVDGSYSVTDAYENTVYDLTVTPDAGYIVNSVKVNGEETALTDGKLRITLTADTTVDISFVKEPRLQMTSISLSENTSFYTAALSETALKVWGYDKDGNKKDLTGNAFLFYESSAPWIFQVSGNKISSGSAAGSALITATYLNPDGSRVSGSVWMTRTEATPVTYGFSSSDTPSGFILNNGTVKGHDGNNTLAYYKKDVEYSNNYLLRAYLGRESDDKNWYTRGLRAAQGWFYDDGVSNTGYYVQMCDNNLFNTKDFNTGFLSSQDHNYWTATKYPIGAFQNGSYYVYGSDVTNVARTVGWHQVMVMLDEENKQIVAYLDGIQVGSTAIGSSTQTSERRGDSCFELRSTLGESAAVVSNVTYTEDHYFDDMAMYDLPASEAPAMAPVVSYASLTGVPMVGQTVTVEYEVKDYNDDELDAAQIKWQVSDNGTDGWADISGATGESFVLTSAQQGKYVRAAVTPFAKVDPKQGETVYSTPSAQVSDMKMPPSAAGVSISGDAAIGSTMTASYTYIKSENGDAEGSTEIIWEKADSPDGPYTQVATGASFVVNAAVAGKYLRATVIPTDINGLQGTPVSSSVVKIPGNVSYYVALDGNDSNPGTFEQPFRTLEAARDAIRGKDIPDGGVTVYIREGTYYMTKTFALTSADSGREGAPIVYRAYGDEKVVFHGGYDLNMSKFTNVSGEMKDLLPADAQGKVLVADLAALGIPEVKEYTIMGSDAGLNAPILNLDGQAMHVARYPNTRDNSQWPKMYCAPGKAGYEGTNLGNGETDGTKAFTVQYDDATAERVNTWTYGLDHVAAEGFWKYDWYASTRYVTINKEKKQISAREDRNTTYGVYKEMERVFCFKNVYQELDEAGEYYIDFDQQKLYLYPFEGTTAASSLKMNNTSANLIEMTNVSYVTIQGIELTSGKGRAINMTNGIGNVIDHCYINGFQNNAVNMTGGYENVLRNSDIEFCGVGGVTVSGGDKVTLKYGNNRVENNKINDFALLKTIYSPGVSVDGVGNYISHNEIYNAEHYAIYFAGVENVIEYNEIHNACTNAADMGAIYTGRHFDDHGVVIRYNHFYDIGNPLSRRFFPCCIFTDDGSSDLDIYGNVFGTGIASVEAIKIHGGQNNNTYHNLFIDSPVVIYSAEWPDSKWRASLSDPEGKSYNVDQYWKRFDSVRNNPLYREKWPWLAEVSDAYDAGNMNSVVHKSNMLAENLIIYVNEQPEEFERSGSNQLQATKGWWRAYGNHPIIGTNDAGGNTNIMLTNEKGDNKKYFEDFDNGNYRLTDESLYDLFDQFDILGAFDPIPFDEIGMYDVSNSAPQAENVSITGSYGSDITLTGLYDYTDPERDPEGKSLYRWLVSDAVDGTYTAIAGAEDRTFAVTGEYNGKFLKFEVTPVSDNGGKGTPTVSQPFAIAADKAALNQVISAVETALATVKVGTKLGEYTAENVQQLQAAVDAAKAVADNDGATGAEVSQAAGALTEAYGAFKATANCTESTSAAEATVTEGLENVEIAFAGGQKEFTVNFAGGIAPKTLIQIGDVSVTIENGTKIPNGKLNISLPDEPSIHLFGEIASLVQVGKAGDEYNKPIRIAFAGNVSQDIVRIGTETYEKITKVLNGDLASALGTSNCGKYGAGDTTVVVWTKLGGEYAAADLITPSAEAQLKNLQINGKEYSKFRPETTSYRYALPAGTTQLPVVTAQASDEKATVEIVNITELPGTAKVIVTAEDLQTKTEYTIEFFVTGSVDPSPVPEPTYNPNPSNSGSSTGTIGGIFTGTIGSEQKKAPFTDIIGHWAEVDINTMYQKGIVNGVSETAFEPDRNITRAEFATLIVKSLGLKSTVSAGFKDVDPYGWYASFVNAAASAGLISGYDGYFRPDDVITREEMAVIVAKAYVFLGHDAAAGGIAKFSDAGDISDWAYQSVDTATTAGLISGIAPDLFLPKEHATRAECASLLKRLLDL